MSWYFHGKESRGLREGKSKSSVLMQILEGVQACTPTRGLTLNDPKRLWKPWGRLYKHSVMMKELEGRCAVMSHDYTDG